MNFIHDTYNALPNYTGPYISNGKFQSSVEFGSTRPKGPLDAQSRLHDSAYAHFPNRIHKAAADEIYTTQVQKLDGFIPEVAGYAVRYVNRLANLYNNPDLDSDAFNTARNEVIEFYKTDPYQKHQKDFSGGGGVNMWDSDVQPYKQDIKRVDITTPNTVHLRRPDYIPKYDDFINAKINDQKLNIPPVYNANDYGQVRRQEYVYVPTVKGADQSEYARAERRYGIQGIDSLNHNPFSKRRKKKKNNRIYVC